MPTLGAFADITKDYGQASFTLTPPTSDIAGAFSYVSDHPEVISVSGRTATIVGAGAGTITATQAADGNCASASRIAQVLVNKVAPTINWPAIIKNYNAPPFMLTPPITNSTGAVTLFRSTSRALTVSGSVATIVVGPVSTYAVEAFLAGTNIWSSTSSSAGMHDLGWENMNGNSVIAPASDTGNTAQAGCVRTLP